MANESMRQTWATGADGWVRNERIFDAALAPFTDAIVGAADLASASRVLDVGCGAGTLVEAAVAAGATDVVGIDISPAMVAAAMRRNPAATIVEADAQTADLAAVAPGGAPFDRVISRFGVMFFADPVAAFANLRSGCAPGARLAVVCWRADERDMFVAGIEPLLRRAASAPPPFTPGAPGPLGLGDPDTIRAVVSGAGWQDLGIDAVDGDCCYSLDGSDGVEERIAILTSGSVGRALVEDVVATHGPDAVDEALDEIRAELRQRFAGDPVRLTGHTWLVTATA